VRHMLPRPPAPHGLPALRTLTGQSNLIPTKSVDNLKKYHRSDFEGPRHFGGAPSVINSNAGGWGRRLRRKAILRVCCHAEAHRMARQCVRIGSGCVARKWVGQSPPKSKNVTCLANAMTKRSRTGD